MARGNSDLVDIALQVHHETERAYLVSSDGNREEAVWLPKSQCDQTKALGKGAFEFTMPEWLAVEKKFL